MTVILVLDQNALGLAQNIKSAFKDAIIHGLAHRVTGADESFIDTTTHLRDLFLSGESIIGLCATGILVRALAPVLSSKNREPAVLAVARDGSIVVPLLGGHNGANRMGEKIAKVCDCKVAITTASEISFGVAIDDPPESWEVLNKHAAKKISARLLAGDPVRLDVDCGDIEWLIGSGGKFDGISTGPRIRVTHKKIENLHNDLIICPPVLALGVGCERDCDPLELEELARKTIENSGLSAHAVCCVVSIDVKMDELAVHKLAESFEVPARFFTAQELEKLSSFLPNPSNVVFNEVGCHGVSEGAALAAVGKGGKLLVEKTRSKHATCAISIDPKGINVSQVGQARGHLSIIGIGPGTKSWRTPEATDLLIEATDIVGYGLYLDLIDDLIQKKKLHKSKLAQEEKRVRHALDLASKGSNVALVCSGDAGIYALASLVFELLDRENRRDWNRVTIQVAPGVSALQAAAARIGAPIGHDFCTISLSDLLTPYAEIEMRLRAAAEGDFVVALYNPVSKRRRTQLAEAQKIIAASRGLDVPVVLARNLGRRNETIEVVKLRDLTPDHADMLTLVLVGSSHSKIIERGGKRWVYTPRGYAKKLK